MRFPQEFLPVNRFVPREVLHIMACQVSQMSHIFHAISFDYTLWQTFIQFVPSDCGEALHGTPGLMSKLKP
jgi:hypothetical protein